MKETKEEEILIVKKFGPISNVELNLKKFTVFIGPQGSGKSTISKLISIFRDQMFLLDDDSKRLNKFLKVYNIDKFLEKNTYFSYQTNNCKLVYTNGKLSFEMYKHYKESVQDNAQKLHDYLGMKGEPDLQNILTELNKRKTSLAEVTQGLIKKLQEIDPDKYDAKAPLEKSIIKEIEELRVFMKIGKAFEDSVFNFQKDPIYIPAERIMISTLSEISFQIWKNDIALPDYIINFGAEFQKSRQSLKKSNIDFLNVSYEYSKKMDTIRINKSKSIPLSLASSGVQSIVPLHLVFQSYNDNLIKDITYVVEEPELHLFPSSQDNLINFLVSNTLNNNDELVLTTHSPYILSSLNKLMFANKIGKLKGKKTKVNKVVKSKFWLPSNLINCYMIDNGEAQSIIDEETGLISNNELDSISNDIADQIDRLVEIQLG